MDQESELLDASRHAVDAFAVLYDRNYRSVLGSFYRRTGCPETAADLAAETFAAAFSCRQNFRPTGAPGSAWLFKIASRQLARFHRTNAVASRAQRRLGMQNTTPSGEDLERIESLFDLRDQLRHVKDRLAELPAASALAVELRIEQQLPYNEIAQRLVCSEGAARVRVSRALSQLAAGLERDGSQDTTTAAPKERRPR